MTDVELLAARQKARRRASRRYHAQAREQAARHGRSLTCQEKPPGRHDTCLGLRAASSDGLGCLCECHDPASEIES